MKIPGLILVSLILLIVPGIAGCASQNPSSAGFAIYLTQEDIPVSQMPERSTYELADAPVISIDDIVSYGRDTHEIELTTDAFERVTTMRVPTSGKVFVVCVGQKQIYRGAFWTPISSQSFDGVTIWVLPSIYEGNIIALECGYPSAQFFRGDDPRPDPEVLESLEKAGKLK